MPIRISVWKRASVTIHERREEHWSKAGGGRERGKVMTTYPLRIAFQSARNCDLWIIGSEGCIYVKYRSTRRSWTCIGGIATSCSSCNKCATSSLALGHLRILGRCHTPPITGKQVIDSTMETNTGGSRQKAIPSFRWSVRSERPRR